MKREGTSFCEDKVRHTSKSAKQQSKKENRSEDDVTALYEERPKKEGIRYENLFLLRNQYANPFLLCFPHRSQKSKR